MFARRLLASREIKSKEGLWKPEVKAITALTCKSYPFKMHSAVMPVWHQLPCKNITACCIVWQRVVAFTCCICTPLHIQHDVSKVDSLTLHLLWVFKALCIIVSELWAVFKQCLQQTTETASDPHLMNILTQLFTPAVWFEVPVLQNLTLKAASWAAGTIHQPSPQTCIRVKSSTWLFNPQVNQHQGLHSFVFQQAGTTRVRNISCVASLSRSWWVGFHLTMGQTQHLIRESAAYDAVFLWRYAPF